MTGMDHKEANIEEIMERIGKRWSIANRRRKISMTVNMPER